VDEHVFEGYCQHSSFNHNVCRQRVIVKTTSRLKTVKISALFPSNLIFGRFYSMVVTLGTKFNVIKTQVFNLRPSSITFIVALYGSTRSSPLK